MVFWAICFWVWKLFSFLIVLISSHGARFVFVFSFSVFFFLVWFCGGFYLIHLLLYHSSQKDGWVGGWMGWTDMRNIHHLLAFGDPSLAQPEYPVCVWNWWIFVFYHYPFHSALNVANIQHMPIINNKAKTITLSNSDLVSRMKERLLLVYQNNHIPSLCVGRRKSRQGY